MAEKIGKHIVESLWQAELDKTRAEGYAAGLEAAAKCAEQHASTPGRELAKTIRALKEKPRP